jgi:hypothetical protein
MNSDPGEIVVIASGTARPADPAQVSRNAPSFFADPAGWLVAAAVEDALSNCPQQILSVPDQVGVVVLGDEGPARTMRDIARTARTGLVSPLRFAGTNPGILAGLPCIRWKLRGPSLNLSMRPAAGIDTAAIVASAWLRSGQADYVIVAATGRVPAGDSEAPGGPEAPAGRTASGGREDGQLVAGCAIVRRGAGSGASTPHDTLRTVLRTVLPAALLETVPPRRCDHDA